MYGNIMIVLFWTDRRQYTMLSVGIENVGIEEKHVTNTEKYRKLVTIVKNYCDFNSKRL